MRTEWMIGLAFAVACGEQRAREDWSAWYDAGSDLDVREPIAFTRDNYTFTGDTPIADLTYPEVEGAAWFANSDEPSSVCKDWSTVDTLPVEISGIVTLHPRWYLKIRGCLPPDPENSNDDDVRVVSDEKFFGNYVVQDATGGAFLLNDSKVAEFSMGDRVTVRVRSVKNNFGVPIVTSHDVVDVTYGPEPIYFEPLSGRRFTEADQNRVKRVEATVAAPMGNFGEVYLCVDPSPEGLELNADGEPACFWNDVAFERPAYRIGLDQELQRRGIDFAIGERIAATGPVFFSFDAFQINVIRVGQIERLDQPAE